MRPFLNKRSVVIIGDGPIGLLHLQLSKMHGFNTAVVGKIEKRLRQAKALRADGVFMAGPQIQNDIAGFTDGYGADIIIIATSNPAALETAFQIAAKDSKINLFAGFAKGSTFTIDPNWLHYNQISITGSFSSTPSMLVQATNLAASKKINLSMIITHKFPLEEIEQAIEVTEKYRGLRAIINKF
jgi:L-iditol 2-dehydrogenase